jgi:hypothetical protein
MTASIQPPGPLLPPNQRAEDPARKRQLYKRREVSRAVPAKPVVKELPPTRTQRRENVLEIRRRTCDSAKRRRIEQATPPREEHDGRNATTDLKSTRAEVLVRHPVAREVENRAEKDGLGSRPSRGACQGAGGHVQRDDHRDLPYVPADRHDLVRALQTRRRSPPRSTSWANLAAGETNVKASGPRHLFYAWVRPCTQ